MNIDKTQLIYEIMREWFNMPPTGVCDLTVASDDPIETRVVPTTNSNKNKNCDIKDILSDIKCVIFNEPATIVTFSDGSKVCVKACSKDTFNKETGLMYAIVKRLYANDIEEKTGYLRSSGLGEKIAKLVKNAVDQKENERQRRKEQHQKEKKKKAKMNKEVKSTEPSEADKNNFN